MTAQELVSEQVAEAGAMLGRLIDGIDAEKADFRSGSLMSAREQLQHLCVCYLACEDLAAGKEPTWDYAVPDGDWPATKEHFRELRNQAVERLSGHDDAAIRNAAVYIVAHDHYHIGQLSSLRIAMDPDWNAYSIYGE